MILKRQLSLVRSALQIYYLLALLTGCDWGAEEDGSDINRSSSMSSGCHQSAHCNLIKMGKERAGRVFVCVHVCTWKMHRCEWLWSVGLLLDWTGTGRCWLFDNGVLVESLHSGVTESLQWDCFFWDIFHLYGQRVSDDESTRDRISTKKTGKEIPIVMYLISIELQV